MKTKIEWRHGERVLKLNDTDYDKFPEVGDVIEMEEAGEVHRFEVQEVESAVVVLETVPDSTPTTHAMRTDPRLRNRRGNSETRTFRVARSKPSKSRALSKTARGNKVVSRKKR